MVKQRLHIAFMTPIRLSAASLLAASWLTACFQEERLPDTLMFPPGTDVTYQGVPSKLYGNAQCMQYGLSGNSCLIFSPESSQATATLISGSKVQQMVLHAKRDPSDPTRFVVHDGQGHTLLSTTGRHDGMANVQIIAP